MIKYLLLLKLFIIPLFSQTEYIELDASSYTEWVYFSFLTHSEVIIDDPENSIGWDIAFMRNHIKTNSGTSGIGAGGVYIDSLNLWTNESFENITEVPLYAEFEIDTMMNTFYDIITHTMSWGSTSPVLETWGWFDYDNNYTFNLTNHQFIIRSANGIGFIKLWPFNYYSETGSSGHISFLYNTDIECNYGIDEFGYCGGDPSLNNTNIGIAKEHSINKIYPNPFNPIVNFNYNIKNKSKIKFEIFDLSGKMIEEIFNSYKNPGEHKLCWNATKYPSGNYFIQLSINNKIIDSKKITYIK